LARAHTRALHFRNRLGRAVVFRSDRLGGQHIRLVEFRSGARASVEKLRLAPRHRRTGRDLRGADHCAQRRRGRLGTDAKRFALAFTAVFWIAYASWIVGNYANFAAVTPADQQKFGVSWSLRLTNEGAYIFALLAGLVIANFLPRFAEAIKEAVRPELYIKVAIVILGGFFAVTAAGKLGFASSILLRGVAAIVEAYLMYWAVVYYIARKWFGFSREWSAPLAAGISICGVSASIAIGGAAPGRSFRRWCRRSFWFLPLSRC
jgi:hypothetical protein